jgi:hypothetical protein
MNSSIYTLTNLTGAKNGDMISMSNFGRNGRLGNQLFQYAFMRTQAETFGLKMFLPAWIGDSVFKLEDDHIRCGPPTEMLNSYSEPNGSFGYNAIALPDAVDVTGFFMSERMFDRDLIRSAYSFHDSILARACQCLGADFDPSSDLAVGIRLGDFCTIATHYCPSPMYYSAALQKFDADRIFLFSDDIHQAVKLIQRAGFEGQIVAMEIPPVLSLAAMSRFRNFIIGPSTFHWWAAWLSTFSDKRVIVPREGATRPGAPFHAEEFWPPGWHTLPALRKWDGYKIRAMLLPVVSRLRKVTTIIDRLC